MRNDLWAFDTSAATWTWLSGANTTNTPGSYGTKGTPSPANLPPARYSGQGWTIGSALWIFGGFGIDSAGKSGYLNDLWSLEL